MPRMPWACPRAAFSRGRPRRVPSPNSRTISLSCGSSGPLPTNANIASGCFRITVGAAWRISSCPFRGNVLPTTPITTRSCGSPSRPRFATGNERCLEARGLEPAAHGGVLIGFADTGRDRPLADVVGNAHVVVSERDHRPLHLPIGRPHGPRLVVVEDQAVQRVNRQRDSCRPCGHTPDDAGLRRVGVHDVGRRLAKVLRHEPEGACVVQRVDRSDHRRDVDEIERRVDARQQVSLGPGFRAREQTHVVFRHCGEALNRRQRVLLRAADDHPGDDVRDRKGHPSPNSR